MTLVAHGIGIRGDLPLPLWMVSYGAGFVLVLSFGALAALWPRARFEGDLRGPRVPPVLDRSSDVLEWVLRLSGLALFAVVWAAAMLGPVDVNRNLAPWAIYVVFWVGGFIASGLIGDIWSVLSPFETVRRIAHGDDDSTRPLERLGVWPAAVLLLAFTWLELVHPTPAAPRTLGLAIAAYVAIMGVGVGWYGWRWLRSAEAFGVLFRILSAMAPFHRDEDGRLRVRWPLVGLADLEMHPGTTAVILVALGSTTFDGVTRQAFWESLLAGRTGWGAVPIGTLGLLLTIGVVAGLYRFAMREAAARTERDATELTVLFAHSLVPIALAYAIAHYFSLVAFETSRFLALLSDPFARGWDLLGTADWSVNYRALSTTVIAWVQAGSIVVGHLAGVLLAHDRAVALFESRRATRSQYALLVAMVAYTVGGLVLLLG